MNWDWSWKEFAWFPTELEPSAGGGREEQVNYRAPVGWRVSETSDTQGRPMADRAGDPKASETLPSPSWSTKRYRRPNGSQSIPCLVDGCNSDLSNCREYHRRHRVCEQHSKTPIVVVGGKQQRFCQQCSRFHALGEFDEVKRSCRKRLDEHNRRRRKPQLSSLFMTGERFLTSYKGPRILQFNDPDIYPALNVRSAWPVLAKNESMSKMYDHQQLWNAIDQQVPPSSLTDMKRGRGSQFSFLQEIDDRSCHGNRATSGASVYTNKALSGTAVSPESGQGSQRLSDGTTRSIDSGCALYLLSSNTTPTSEWSLVQSSSIGHTEQAQCLEQHFGAADKHLSSRGDKDKPSCPG